MKKTLLSSIFALALGSGAFAQTVVNDSITTAANYDNQIWYSLANGQVGTSPRNNWDIAFEAQGYSAAILVNTQAGDALYQTPFGIGAWSSLDTAGLSTWQKLVDSDTSWAVGAFNNAPANQFDLGWGTYDQNSHVVAGDSIYILKLAIGGIKKLRIDDLASGVYTFTYANIDGTNEVTKTVDKANFSTKNFGYFSFATETTLDREPATTAWDLTFVKYITTLFIPQPFFQTVTGVLSNKNVTVAQADGVDVDSVKADNYTFSSQINTIGYDWKTFDNNTMAYTVTDSIAYFVETNAGDLYKVIFTGFAGATTGQFNFSKQLIVADTVVTPVGIEETNQAFGKVAVYPNPSNGQDVTLIYSMKNDNTSANLTISDVTGRMVYTSKLATQAGLYTHKLSTENLQAGLYIVSLQANGTTVQQKLIVQ